MRSPADITIGNIISGRLKLVIVATSNINGTKENETIYNNIFNMLNFIIYMILSFVDLWEYL